MKKVFASIVALLLLFTTGCSAQSIDETEIILTTNNPVMGANGIKHSIDKAEAIDTALTTLNNQAMLPILFVTKIFDFTVNGETEIRERKADNSQPADSTPNPTAEPQPTETTIPEENTMTVTINQTAFTAVLSDNSSAEAFRNLLKEKDITIEMHDYANFEKVGNLGTTLPRNDEQITTEPGDIILYQGNQITIYYDTNSWNFTRLGKINNATQSELMAAMGTGNATVTFSLDN